MPETNMYLASEIIIPFLTFSYLCAKFLQKYIFSYALQF